MYEKHTKKYFKLIKEENQYKKMNKRTKEITTQKLCSCRNDDNPKLTSSSTGHD